MGKRARRGATHVLIGDYTTQRLMEIAVRKTPDEWRERTMRLADDNQITILRTRQKITFTKIMNESCNSNHHESGVASD